MKKFEIPNAVITTSKKIDLNKGFYMEITMEYKGWKYIYGLFGNILLDPENKVRHDNYGGKICSLEDAINLIDSVQ